MIKLIIPTPSACFQFFLIAKKKSEIPKECLSRDRLRVIYVIPTAEKPGIRNNSQYIRLTGISFQRFLNKVSKKTKKVRFFGPFFLTPGPSLL